MPYERVQTGPPPPRATKRVRPAVALAPVEYEAVTGITHPDGPENLKLALAGKLDEVTGWARIEPGEKSSDIPAIDIPWLLEQGFIKEVK